jgi:hypothetical protein
MISISTYYDEAILQEEQKWKIKLRFATSKGKLDSDYVELTDDDIIQNSLSITSEATSNSYFCIGGVGSRKLSFTLMSAGIAKLNTKSLLNKGNIIKVDTWLKTSDPNQSDDDFSLNIDGTENTSGKVEMGFYYVYTISNSDYQCQVDAYDAMLKFDVEITHNIGFSLQMGPRTIYEWLVVLCDAVSTEDDVIELDDGVESALINNTQTFLVDSVGDLKTYRTTLGYLSILTAGFFEISRQNKLKISFYQRLCSFISPHKNVFEYSVDANTYYISTVSTVVAGFDYTTEEFTLQGDYNPIDLSFSENYFLRGIQDYEADELGEEIIACIDELGKYLEGFKFIGGSFTLKNRPDFELGDNITINVRTTETDVDNNVSVVDKEYSNILITKHTWTYQTYSQITSNKYSEQSSSTNTTSFKTYTGGGSSSAVNSVYYTIGTNDVSIKAGDRSKLFEVLFLVDANISSHVSIIAVANIKLSYNEDIDYVTGVELDEDTGELIVTKSSVNKRTLGKVYFTIVHNNSTYTLTPTWSVDEGYFTFSFDFATTSVDTDRQHSLIIYMNCEDCAVSIDKYQYEILINASGISEPTNDWTGRFELTDRLPVVNFNNLFLVKKLTDEVSVD